MSLLAGRAAKVLSQKAIKSINQRPVSHTIMSFVAQNRSRGSDKNKTKKQERIWKLMLWDTLGIDVRAQARKELWGFCFLYIYLGVVGVRNLREGPSRVTRKGVTYLPTSCINTPLMGMMTTYGI